MSVDDRPQAFPGVFRMMLTSMIPTLIHAAIELSMFDLIASGSDDAPTLARKAGTSERGARLLLNALASIGLLTADGDRYSLSRLAAVHLVRGQPAYVGDMVKVYANSWDWRALETLPDAVRRGGTVLAENLESPRYGYWEDFAANSGAAAGKLAELTANLFASWTASRSTLRILDVACGNGAYGFALARRHATAHVSLLDWDNILPYAREQAERLGLADRISTIAGNMFEVPLGGPYDLVVVANVLHHFSPQRGTGLLRRVAATLAPDGRIALVNFVDAESPSPQDAGAHLFSILTLLWTEGGQAYRAQEYGQMAQDAGLRVTLNERVPVLPLSVMAAERA